VELEGLGQLKKFTSSGYVIGPSLISEIVFNSVFTYYRKVETSDWHISVLGTLIN
jgi:hypothetical protein